MRKDIGLGVYFWISLVFALFILFVLSCLVVEVGVFRCS